MIRIRKMTAVLLSALMIMSGINVFAGIRTERRHRLGLREGYI